MDIERLAVSHIDDLVGRCPNLTSYINASDKIPLTDGHIDVYSAPSKTNADHVGRVDVQVKGRTVKDRKKAAAPYRVRVRDLEAYLNVSGVLYLVVDIRADSRKKKANYALLTPFRVARVLRDTKPGQKTVEIPLKSFPKKPERIEELLRFAVRTRVQNPRQGFDFKLMEQASEITVHGFGKVDATKPMVFNLDADDCAAFVKTEGGMEIPLPGEFHVMPPEYLGERFKCTIRSGDVSFSDPIRRRLDEHTVEFQLSENLRFAFASPESEMTGRLTYSLADCLDARLQDLGFFLACVGTRQLRLDDNIVRILIEAPEDLHELRAHHRYLERLETLLNRFKAPTSLISLADVTEERSNQLGAIYSVVMHGASPGEDQQVMGRIYQPIGRWGLELMAAQPEGHWTILDVFAPGLPFSLAREMETPSGERQVQLVTPYEMLDVRQTARTLNLHLDSIVGAYEAIAQSADVGMLANSSVLRLIHAADIEPERVQEFLDGAERLNNWLIERSGSEPHHIINRAQIHLRRRELTHDEKSILKKLRRESLQSGGSQSAHIELACTILLGEHSNVPEAMEQLTATEREDFMTWPIWNLVEGKNAEGNLKTPKDEPTPELWIKWLDTRGESSHTF